MSSPRVMLGWASVAAVVLVNCVAIVAGTPDARIVLTLCGLVAVAVTVHGVMASATSGGWGLVLSAVPVVALLTHGRPAWLIGPLSAVLLIAAELSALSWEFRGLPPDDAYARHRIVCVARLGAGAMGAALLIGLVSVLPAPGGTAAVVVAALALGALARVTFVPPGRN